MDRETPTTPFVNYIFNYELTNKEACGQLAEEYKWVTITMNPAKKEMKARLGRQTYCVQYTDRNWVWTGDLWNVLVSTTGFTFEVKEGISFEEARAAWDDFRSKANLLRSR